MVNLLLGTCLATRRLDIGGTTLRWDCSLVVYLLDTFNYSSPHVCPLVSPPSVSHIFTWNDQFVIPKPLTDNDFDV